VSTIPIRPAGAADLGAVDALQRSCPEASHWNVADYLDHQIYVAIVENSIGGFVVFRNVASDEREILNLAVAPALRRKGIASALLGACLKGFEGTVFLEVRESNQAAREFYNRHSFQEVSRRPKYYESPPETAIVMKFHSC
jgi:ribosomal-protein-alanine N-acetyltransferase